MESFDQSLKYLLQHEPADFIRFGLGEPAVEVFAPIPSDLPSRGRDVDGGYVVVRNGERVVAHIEFHRRHQATEELAIDVAEAQIRIYRRDRLRVFSLVWDLYGKRDEPLFEEHELLFGASLDSQQSRAAYRRVNLRALAAEELLATAPPALWPLVPLTRDGASEEGVRRARDAIEGRTDLSSEEQADHLAVLWFVAEAEDVPTKLMTMYLSEERLMESSLYKSAFEKGEARGRAETLAKVLMRTLIRTLGSLDPAVRERIRAVTDPDTLEVWCEEAIVARDAEAARGLVEKILSAPAA